MSTFQTWWDTNIEKNSNTLNGEILKAIRDVAGAAWVSGYNQGYKEGVEEEQSGFTRTTKTKPIKSFRRGRNSSLF